MIKIIISNIEKFELSKSEIKKGGFKNLHIISDFDNTLTKAFINGGEHVPSIISVLRDENYLNNGYSKKAKDLYKYYHSIEIDNSINIQEKTKAMQQWWSKHSELLILSGLNKNDIIKSAKSNRIIFRDGIFDVFNLLNSKKVPFVILSASGLGDESIIETLKFHNLYFPNIDVISNIIIWDSNGIAIDYKTPHIHSFNKNENFIKNSSTYKKIKNKKNIILLGDSINDSKMSEGFDYNNLLKIGFLNYDEENRLEEYKKNYDVIITGDGNMKFIYDFLMEI